MTPVKKHGIGSPEVCVVEASAGSGKTYALATRYLRLLLNPDLPFDYVPLRTILAITFTNKATVEMKERILQLLKMIALDIFPSAEEKKELLSRLEVDEKKARAKAALIMDWIVSHYNFFQVQTIDSFINALLLGSALNIDRSASFRIKREYREALAYCLDLTIDHAASNPEVYSFLEEFLEHYLFVENRASWFPRKDILELIRSLFQLRNKYGRFFRIYDGKSSDVLAKNKNLLSLIDKLSQQFPAGMNASAKKYINGFLEKSNEYFNIADLPPALSRPEPPLNKGKDCPPEFCRAWTHIRKELTALVELDARLAYKPYIVLFDRLLDFFQQLSRKEDVLFLEELNQTARLLFGEEGVTVAELYYRLATRFRHYLIDEFQDTSALQWSNLEMMVEEALSTGGTLFYVGDKKQAIYRFRGGDVRLFDRIREQFSPFNLRTTALTRNWRSQKAVVEFNNTLFSPDNLKRTFDQGCFGEELAGNAAAREEMLDIFRDAVQEIRPDCDKGYVRVVRIEGQKQNERDEFMRGKLIESIRDLRDRSYRYEDIALLTRDNTEVELVTSWLLEAGIAVESEKTLNVLEHHLIKELISFLRFLHSPIDDLSFASFILGDMFSAASGIAHDEITGFLFTVQVNSQQNKEEALYRLFRENYGDIWRSLIEPFFKSAGLISPYELLASIYRNLKVFRYFSDSRSFLMKFLELIKIKEDEYVGLGDFLDYLPEALPDDLYVTVTRSDAVKVLTVHKAKGLEFPVVIIPFLRMNIKAGEGGVTSQSARFYIEDEDAPQLGLLRITKEHRRHSAYLESIHFAGYRRSFVDELNNIYVALTRAEQELHIFIPVKSGSRANPVCGFIPEKMAGFGSPGTGKAGTTKEEQPLMELKTPLLHDWIGALRDEFGDASRVRNLPAVRRGSAMHEILSHIDRLSSGEEQTVLSQALNKAALRYPFVKDDPAWQEAVFSLVTSQNVSRFFYLSDGQVYCEKELVDNRGDTKRIDRLIVRDNEIQIVDYKSSSEKYEDYAAQIRGYMRVIQSMYPEGKVTGFLVYMDSLQVEEIKEVESSE